MEQYIFNFEKNILNLKNSPVKNGFTFTNNNQKYYKKVIKSYINQNTFKSYQNKHLGETCVILGTGPTLNEYFPIKNAIHIGVNSGIFYKKIILDYYFMMDFGGKNGFNNIKETIYNTPVNIQKFIATFHINKNSEFTIPDKYIKNHVKQFEIIKHTEDIYPPPKDISNYCLGMPQTIIFSALQFALFSGFKKILLVGCDLGEKPEHGNYLFKDHHHNYNSFKNQWIIIKKWVQQEYPNVNIYNIEPVGLKDIFPLYKKTFLERYIQRFERFIDFDYINNPPNHRERYKNIILPSDINKKNILPFKNKHLGETCVLLGSGTTLNQYIPIKNAIHIGVNSTIFYDKVTLDYFFMMDKNDTHGFDNIKDTIYNTPVKHQKFIGKFKLKPNDSIDDKYIKNGIKQFEIINKGGDLYPPPPDIGKYCFGLPRNTMYSAMQFALYCGFKKIYLVGIDLGRSGNGHKGHFKFDNHCSVYDGFYYQWTLIKKWARKDFSRVKIYNINPVGLKDVFPEHKQ